MLLYVTNMYTCVLYVFSNESKDCLLNKHVHVNGVSYIQSYNVSCILSYVFCAVRTIVAFFPVRVYPYSSIAGAHLVVQSSTACTNTPVFSRIKSISCSSCKLCVKKNMVIYLYT